MTLRRDEDPFLEVVNNSIDEFYDNKDKSDSDIFGLSNIYLDLQRSMDERIRLLSDPALINCLYIG